MAEDREDSGKSWLWLGLGIAMGVGAGSYYAWKKVGDRYRPQLSGGIRLEGLSSSVEVWRDRWGVPHIYADNEQDLFFAQGFVQAQDRLWQMELNRRVASGRVSAIFGRLGFEIDRFTHRAGLPRAAEADMAALDSASVAILDAYCDGVNAFMAQRKLPVEFTILRYRPEPWRPIDTLYWLKMFCWSLSTNFETELMRARLVKRLGTRLASKLEPLYPKGHPVINPPGSDYDGAAAEILNAYAQYSFAPIMAAGGGSNNWVVSGSHTVSGRPLLANDPHLPLQMPSIWYEMHLACPSFEAVGATIPAAPGVALGHNRDIAWGATASLVDVQDLFIEQFHPENRGQYLRDGVWKQAEVQPIEIEIKGETPYYEETYVTEHGPVIAEMPGDDESTSNYKLSIQWAGHQPTDLLGGFIALNRARNWQEFRDAFRDWRLPGLNMVYADTTGNIGYQLIGSVPIRKTGGGTLPMAGWISDNDWQGFIPYDEMPSLYNPPSGYIVTANNRTVSTDYPYHITGDFVPGFRARRIRDLLEERGRISIEDCRQIQIDDTTIPGRRLAAQIVERLKDIELSALACQALAHLDGWTGQATVYSVAESLYQITLQRLLEMLLGGLLEEDLHEYLGRAHAGSLSRINSLVGRFLPTILDMIERDDRSLLDELWQPRTWTELLKESYERAVADLAQRFGPDTQRWNWGRLHTATFQHPLGQVRALKPLFNRGPYAVAGDGDTPSQMAFMPLGTARGGFEILGWAVSYRQVIDLADFDRSKMCHTTGQSGSPFSKHYDDMIPMWVRGELHDMLWSRRAVTRNAREKLLLLPARNEDEMGLEGLA